MKLWSLAFSMRRPIRCSLVLRFKCFAHTGARRVNIEIRLKGFVRGVDWDADEDVRIAALSAAGELLRERVDTWLVGLLAATFTSALESHMARQAAYFALARAFGQQWEDLPPASRRIDLEKDVDPKVVEWALRAR